MVRKLIVVVIVLAIIGLGAFWLLTAPKTLAAAELPDHQPNVENGAYMFRAGGCESCHAAPGAKGEGKADTAKLGITGFCWGGRITWLYDAHNPAVKAGVAWYGRVVGDASAMTPKHPIDIAKQLHGPVLGLYGGADTGIPNDTVDKMRAALKAAGTPAASKSEIVTYPDMPHAFNADYRPSYRKEAAEDGWKRALAWFKANGV